MNTSKQEASLDDLDRIRGLDSSDMFKFVSSMPEQLSLALGVELLGEWPALEFENILLCGMGGSAIGGDLAQEMAGASLKIPYLVHRTSELPAFVDKRTLLVLSSYSGNTEEVLLALSEGLKRGCRPVCLTSGGALFQRAHERGFATFQLPAGMPPRTTVGLSATLVLRVLERAANLDPLSPKLEQVSQWLSGSLKEIGPEQPCSRNLAKQTAVKLKGVNPVFYAATGRMASVARRWAGQLCENAKQLALSRQFPEMNHNEIVGWAAGSNGSLRPVFLRDGQEDIRLASRLKATFHELREQGVETFEICARGPDFLTRLWWMIFLGDFVSLYLAVLNEVDPTPVRAIDRLKHRIKTSNV